MGIVVRKLTHEGDHLHVEEVEMMRCPKCAGHDDKCERCHGEGLVDKRLYPPNFIERPRTPTPGVVGYDTGVPVGVFIAIIWILVIALIIVSKLPR